MKIEKVNDNKIRVTFNIDDLNEKNIDFHSFMSNSIESQKLFLDMLDEAKNTVGFITDNYKVLIETAATDNGNFICNLTRTTPDLKKDTFYSSPSNVHIKNFKDSVSYKAKKNSHNSNLTVYAFNSFDDFTDFCNFFIKIFKDDAEIFSKNSKLFLYGSVYYLLLDNVLANFDLLERFCACIAEFAIFTSNSNCFEDKLMEFGDVIIDNNAILATSKYLI